ncbi:hypothetical protein FGB62_6g416 [Gracilaria domingensis]|nr:hypothetical protein FGB62_6g416 [Gracilaria domingensis]
MGNTDTDTMLRFYRTADLFFSLRDEYVNEGDASSKPRDASYRAILQYAAEKHEHPDVAREFLEHEMQSRNLGNFTVKYLRDYVVAKKPLEQVYMVCRLLDITDDSSDTRTRDFFMMLSRSAESLPTRCYLTPFIRAFSSPVKNQPDSFFKTVLRPTRFGLLLYLSSLLHIWRQEETAKRKKKRVARGAVRVTILEWFRNFGNNTCQRTGFAVERTMYAWDIFARGLGFDDVEMLENRSIGYCPVTHHTCLEDNVEATPQKGGLVATFRDKVDANLRVLAKEFLDDVHGICTHDRLYSLQENKKHERWVTLEHLTLDLDRKARNPNHTRDLPFPEWFDRLAEDLWRPIQEAKRDKRREEQTSGKCGKVCGGRQLGFLRRR